MEALWEDGGYLIILAICLIVWGMSCWKPEKPAKEPTQTVKGKRPPLPGRSQGSIYDYPKCPEDRRRNEPGKPQLIFWSERRQCYYCGNGHYFTGKEY